MVALMTFYGLLWAAAGNDIIAITFNLSINQITYFMRVAVFVGPLLAFWITRRWCISLQRHDHEQLLHGYETGVIMRSAEGGYTERHAPIEASRAYTLTARDRDPVPNGDHADEDGAGVPPPHRRGERIRRRLRELAYADNIQKPTRADLAARHHDAAEENELQTGLDHPVDGHQYDGRREVDGKELRR
jgi:ubiquinol-cytochrome c reductase cytochrome b subunit